MTLQRCSVAVRAGGNLEQPEGGRPEQTWGGGPGRGAAACPAAVRAWLDHPSALVLHNISLPPPCLQALLRVFAELLCRRPPVATTVFLTQTNLLHGLCSGLIRPCNRPELCCKCTDQKQDHARQDSCSRLEGQATIPCANIYNHSFAGEAATSAYCVSTAAAWQTTHSCCAAQ